MNHGKHRRQRSGAPQATGASTASRPLVTVLIPCHDGEGEIGDTVRAVLTQSRRPDRVIVVADNCSDGTEAVAMLAGAEVFATEGNTARKAGALNQALAAVLPGCSPHDVIAGFDDDTMPAVRFLERALAWIASGYGAVGATFHGRDGGGTLGLLQRAEFARFARHQQRKLQRVDVLSGTGWAYTAATLRAVADARPDGEVYDVRSIAEDFELTLAMKALGVRMISPGDCSVTTDVMASLPELYTQRMRWQFGTLTELRRYGWTRTTRGMIARQIVTYAGMLCTLATIGYLAWSYVLYGVNGINPARAPQFAAIIALVICEQAWQCRKAGPRAIVMTLILLPELAYNLVRQVVYIIALAKLASGRKTPSWGAGHSGI